MKVIILAGGFGTRLSEYTDLIPKPMVLIGGNPILWHIMKIYEKYNHCLLYTSDAADDLRSTLCRSRWSPYH